MARKKVKRWTSRYTYSSKRASEGKLREVFRGEKEIKEHVKKVQSIVVHKIPIGCGFYVMNPGNRVFYGLTDNIGIITNSNQYCLYEDEKIFLNQSYDAVTVANISGRPRLVVEISSCPFDNLFYRDRGGLVSHIPALKNSEEIDEYLDGKLSQITIHGFCMYETGGDHYHLDGKIEMFTVVDGSVHTFEKEVAKREKPIRRTAGFGDLTKRVTFDDDKRRVDHELYMQEGSFVLNCSDSDGNYVAHTLAASISGALVIELSNVAFDPKRSKRKTVPYVILPQKDRGKVIEALTSRYTTQLRRD